MILELESSFYPFLADLLSLHFLAAAEDFFFAFFGLQVFYSSFKDIVHISDSRICVIESFGGHGMIDDVHNFIGR